MPVRDRNGSTAVICILSSAVDTALATIYPNLEYMHCHWEPRQWAASTGRPQIGGRPWWAGGGLSARAPVCALRRIRERTTSKATGSQRARYEIYEVSQCEEVSRELSRADRNACCNSSLCMALSSIS